MQITLRGYDYYYRWYPDGENFHVPLTPDLHIAIRHYHSVVSARLEKMLGLEKYLKHVILLRLRVELYAHQVADKALEEVLLGIKTETCDHKPLDSICLKAMSEAEAVECIRDAVLPVFRPALASYSRSRALHAMRILALYFPGIQGEYESYTFQRNINLDLKSLTAVDAVNRKPILSVGDFCLPSNVRDWKAMVFNPVRHARIRRLLSRGGSDAASDVFHSPNDRKRWFCRAGEKLGLELSWEMIWV
ncbi:hypothetical protein FN846DRAFT_912597 [Sphaerosporella brunnea]|uniref:Uncharacterized protein n=1 Tax=Sphaerosporella brunnea TaxID=1250544 RepID=A0A5J5EHV6_9PEZI|nr:hypothetical protein FN846DRAFT_912597 [Sphaerosporella brunnea]